MQGGRKKLQFPTNISLARTRLKIDGPLPIHAFTAIVPGAYPGEAKMCSCQKLTHVPLAIAILLVRFVRIFVNVSKSENNKRSSSF